MLTNGNWTYTWNGENRLIKAENSSTGIKVEFDYDYMGRRIFKKVYSGETLEKHLRFVYDGYKLIEERKAVSDILRTFASDWLQPANVTWRDRNPAEIL